jgi:hypothetical protein
VFLVRQPGRLVCAIQHGLELRHGNRTGKEIALDEVTPGRFEHGPLRRRFHAFRNHLQTQFMRHHDDGFAQYPVVWR